jgi:hypothetical protein
MTFSNPPFCFEILSLNYLLFNYPFLIISPHVRVKRRRFDHTKEILDMRKKMIAVAAVIALVMGAVEAKPIFMTVLGTGVVQDTDRSSAASQAVDQAMDSANSSCVGTIVKAVKSPPICFGGGDNPYTCTVIVTATCQIGN